MTGQPTAAEVLAAHQCAGAPLYSGARVGPGYECSCGVEHVGQHTQHQADMLAAAGLLVTPEHDAQVAARALREAVTYLRGWFGGPEPASIPVLAAYADRIERGEAT